MGPDEAPPAPAPAIEARADDFDPTVSLTLAPLALVLPVVELSAEVRLAPEASAALIGGAGRSRGETLWEAGVQGRFYAAGDFEQGLDVGLEALVRGASGPLALEGATLALLVGPFAGVKLVIEPGLTLDLHGGLQYVALVGTEPPSPPVAGLFRTNVGWSF